MHVSIRRFQQCIRRTAVILLQLFLQRGYASASAKTGQCELEVLFMHSHSEKYAAMWGLQYVKQQLHHDGKMADHQISPEKVWLKY